MDPRMKITRPYKNLIPVTIRQIMTSFEDHVDICGVQAVMVNMVAIVKSVELDDDKITYMVSDDTGAIEVLYYKEGSMTENPSEAMLKENTYCYVAGAISNADGKRCVTAYKVRPLVDLNELTMHILEVMYAKKKINELAVEQVISVTNAMAKPQQLFSETKAPVNSLQQIVLRIIQNCKDPNGIHIKDIQTFTKGKFDPKDVEFAVDFLASEGHVYVVGQQTYQAV